ncbi:ABC transporter substrate-binding protein [Pseudoteredinibacter isoporae]|uniref:Solute-binding protein family 3/N-terminal domain-containing protein n=1 Tax=Pseudoteredinibacter isoporae TaxID=570281 RepID=A0A7X0JW98_9GAMM|nr:ABC transporter substrate-binding protein [Pseudoteredinibacter isoporae]MBB6523393.1 hypothetical protein [Pseudoteredinibacter isoporae]NHO88904.1 ABC transporter substrate-binding protein [Pseudoteredinibacter isoporae]NIB24388.1 ABC transporter substrate-binding protein [Pseudoteredinibacter isoporae]
MLLVGANTSAYSQSPAHDAGRDAVELWFFQTNVRYHFRTEAIKLALSYSADMKPEIRLRPWTEPLTQQRAVSVIRSGEYPIFASLTEHRQFRLPELVRSDRNLAAGVMGFRVLLSQKDRLEKLKTIETLKQMRKQLRFGFGQHWLDYSILQANGLELVGTPHYSNLFPMLEAGRFDAIPRGLNEFVAEEQYWGKRYQSIRSFDTYALYYPYPVYLYMHKDYEWILERINYGVFRAQNDGSMRRLFEKHFADEIDWLNTKQPRLFVLRNDFVDPSLNIENLCWWVPQALLEQISPSESCH